MTTAVGPESPAGLNNRRYGSTSLRVGAATMWLSTIVLLPLAAILWQSAGGGWEAFRSAVTSPAAVASFRVTVTISVRHGRQRGVRGARRLGADARPVPG